MEWTQEKRYLPYNKWDADTLLHLQAQAANSPAQMHYHLRPISGLVNDPNGFSFFNGEYHLFYQSFPFGAVHGLKSWWHFKSKDLVHWENLGIGLEPDAKADSHGAYSGSAKQIGDKLFIMYTGNHRTDDWERIPYQIGVWMDKDNKLGEKEILFKNPDHISEHFRDPQIIEKDGKYYAILGAQDEKEKHGHVDVWSSEDLKDWKELGFLDFSDKDMGYMIECPNLVEVDGKNVLIFCPQGLDKSIADYDNIYPNMYVVADQADLENHTLMNSSQLKNLDDGFDVYATQAFNAPNGKAYAVSWVGLPDISYPTDNENWANCLSQVKELTIENGKLLQKPVDAIKSLRENEQSFIDERELTTKAGQQYELKMKISAGQKGNLYLQANSDLSENLKLSFDTENGELVLDRSKAGEVSANYGTSRKIVLAKNKDLDLDIFVDHSLIEVFVNGGEHVLTGRFFTNQDSQKIVFDNETSYQATLWQMKTIL
ncbi:sucrose-6-phosphate hydrolase [Lactobacillus kalixensis]|uniref:Sucrose-6-phosphate hydrolase n=1 Tax=Lactobacillus kalixensis DSM 16043 TaxID=1423763 RepID=A0A0R1UJY4_9LACO|nr:sucrose-6-phosphate hydrolase [Lactobacillus kalixensis]KRL91237.1 sucrose-6-p hydrolase [Lactobacillus kalixensis DSM 16043]